MKNKIIFIVGLIMIGLLSYFGSYYAYISSNQRVSPIQTAPIKIEKYPISNKSTQSSYYLARIEGDLLKIYKMPESRLFETVQLTSIWIDGEEEQLREGIVLKDFSEVVEFLENRMS